MERTEAVPAAPKLTSLAANLAAFIVPPLLLNGIIFGLGWNGNTAPSPYLPPGWLVGTIWMVLFTAMGVARWLLVRTPADMRAAWPVTLLAFLCMIYPLYTLGLSSEKIGLAGSVATGAVAVWVVARLLRVSRTAAALTGLVWRGWSLPPLHWRGQCGRKERYEVRLGWSGARFAHL